MGSFPKPVSRLLIASLGSIGARHARRIAALRPDVAVAVLRSGRGGEAPDDLAHLPTFAQMDDALAWGPQAAVIGSPAPFHVPMARALIAADVAVLVEKPLSATLDGVAALVAQAETAGVPAAVAYVLRHRLIVAQAREVLASGLLGTVTAARFASSSWLPDWRPDAEYRTGVSARADLGGGALLELSHEVDLACLLCGVPQAVTAHLARVSDLEIDVEDTADLLWRAGDVDVSVHMDFATPGPGTRHFMVTGTQGRMEADLVTGTLRLLDREGVARESGHPEPDRNAMYDRQLTAFLAAVETGAPVACPLADGARVMAVIAAAQRSHANKTEQQVDAV